MKHHKNCRRQVPALSTEASDRLRYIARGHLGGQTCLSNDKTLLRPGEKSTLFAAVGAGFLTTLTAKTQAGGDSLLIHIYTTGEAPDISMRLRDFFLSGKEGRDMRARFAGKQSFDSGVVRYYRHLFIPFGGQCSIVLENSSEAAIEAELAVQYVKQPSWLSFGRHGRALGLWCGGRAREIGEEIVVADIRGRGVLHSVQMVLENPLTRGMYMEGNLELYIDGNPLPEYQSTGTEEFFMGGVYFANLHNSEYSGCTRTFNDGSENPDNIVSAYRVFIEDEITFNKSLKILWHNGQPGQGPVIGPTQYDFTAVYYLEDSAAPSPALPLQTAAQLLSRVDGDRYSRMMRGAEMSVGGGTPVSLEGPGVLESLYLELEQETDAEIAFEIDGFATDFLPLSAFFCLGDKACCTGPLGGRVGEGIYFKLCDIPFRKTLKILLNGGRGACYFELREGLPNAMFEYRQALVKHQIDSPHRKYSTLADKGRTGQIDAMVFASGGEKAAIDLTDLDSGPIVHGAPADFLLFPNSRTGESGVRSFADSPMIFNDGLNAATLHTQPDDTLAIIYKIYEDKPADAREYNTSELLARLNRADFGSDSYECRCYNAIEGYDGAIAAGETRLMWEDFGAGMLKCLRFGTPPQGSALHEARLRIYLNGDEAPAIDTTCARFFSAEYDDPIFWSGTRRLSRLSKRGETNLKNKGQHSSFLRYLSMPYQSGARVTLTAPEDSLLSGFDNVYFGSARGGALDFGPLNRTVCRSEQGDIGPSETFVLATSDSPAAVSSIQLMLDYSGTTALGAAIELVCADNTTLLSVPLSRFFFGMPPSRPNLGVLGEYAEQWVEKQNACEAFFTTPDAGWVRRGEGRSVVYRLLEERPLLMPAGAALLIRNGTGGTISVKSDILLHEGL